MQEGKAVGALHPKNPRRFVLLLLHENAWKSSTPAQQADAGHEKDPLVPPQCALDHTKQMPQAIFPILFLLDFVDFSVFLCTPLLPHHAPSRLRKEDEQKKRTGNCPKTQQAVPLPKQKDAMDLFLPLPSEKASGEALPFHRRKKQRLLREAPSMVLLPFDEAAAR